MKMPKEKHLELVEAWWDGSLEINCNLWHTDRPEDWRPVIVVPRPSDNPLAYRIRSKPTLRKWKPEEVPVGAQYRYKASPEERSLILGVTAVELQLPMIVRNQSITFHRALEDGEHSTDGGKTWKPCGMEE